MNILELYDMQLRHMENELKKHGREKNEYVHVEMMGVEVREISHYGQDRLLLIGGLDDAGKEAALVIHEGSFYAKLSVAKKKTSRSEIGFKLPANIAKENRGE